MWNYDKLRKKLHEKGISTYRLINEYGVSNDTLNRLRHNENVTMETLDFFCQILQCPIQDIVEVLLEDVPIYLKKREEQKQEKAKEKEEKAKEKEKKAVKQKSEEKETNTVEKQQDNS